WSPVQTVLTKSPQSITHLSYTTLAIRRRRQKSQQTQVHPKPAIISRNRICTQYSRKGQTKVPKQRSQKAPAQQGLEHAPKCHRGFTPGDDYAQNEEGALLDSIHACIWWSANPWLNGLLNCCVPCPTIYWCRLSNPVWRPQLLHGYKCGPRLPSLHVLPW
ncbi:Hypothetical predicted protein, partial [Pelobates cultripes]